MKYPALCLIVISVLCSCESEDDLMNVTMQDGNTITINSSQRYYHSEEEFVHCVSFSFPRSCEYSEVEEVEYLKDSEGIVSGYSQSFIGCWEAAKFGEWVRDYGLNPNDVYYVATKVYTKYVSMPCEGLRIVPKFGGQFMGYCPDVEPRTFRVNNDSDAQVGVLTTGVRYIGYDSEGNRIACEMPSFIH